MRPYHGRVIIKAHRPIGLEAGKVDNHPIAHRTAYRVQIRSLLFVHLKLFLVCSTNLLRLVFICF